MRECEAGEPSYYNKKEREKKEEESKWAGLKKWTGLADNGERN
jgi:hypothetical protein